MARKLLKKEEIKNIISKNWDERRKLQEERNLRKLEKCKEWKAREKLGLNTKRRKHFLAFGAS